MVPVIPAPETTTAPPAGVKTGADCNRRKLRANKLKSVDRSMMLLKLRSGNRKRRLKTLNCNFPTRILLLAAGQIGSKSVEVGQRVQPGTPLMAIVSNDLWVVANFKETQLANMKPGQKVEIKLDAFGGRKFEGRLDSFSPASGAQFSLLPPDNATGNFTKVVQRIPVKVVFDAESIKGYESRIAPGMSATVNVELK